MRSAAGAQCCRSAVRRVRDELCARAKPGSARCEVRPERKSNRFARNGSARCECGGCGTSYMPVRSGGQHDVEPVIGPREASTGRCGTNCRHVRREFRRTLSEDSLRDRLGPITLGSSRSPQRMRHLEAHSRAASRRPATPGSASRPGPPERMGKQPITGSRTRRDSHPTAATRRLVVLSVRFPLRRAR